METHREGCCCRKRSPPEERTAIDHPSDGSSLLRYPELHLLKTNFPRDDVTRELSVGCVWAECFQPERKDCVFRKLLFVRGSSRGAPACSAGGSDGCPCWGRVCKEQMSASHTKSASTGPVPRVYRGCVLPEQLLVPTLALTMAPRASQKVPCRLQPLSAGLHTPGHTRSVLLTPLGEAGSGTKGNVLILGSEQRFERLVLFVSLRFCLLVCIVNASLIIGF